MKTISSEGNPTLNILLQYANIVHSPNTFNKARNFYYFFTKIWLSISLFDYENGHR